MNAKTTPRLAQRRLSLAVCAALAALTSATALADPLFQVKLFRDSDVMFRDNDMSRWTENYLELGLGYNSADSYKFGQFSGLTEKGSFPMLGFNWLQRGDNDAEYWKVHGANLGLDSRKFLAEYGVQGMFGIRFSADQLAKAYTESGHFLHEGLGSSTLTLPAGVAPGAYLTANAVPNASLQPFGIKHGRDIYRLGLSGKLGKEWDYRVNFRQDERDGTRLTGVYQFVSMVVPYQINDRTRQIEATLGYTTRVAQMQLGYTLSHYDNDVTSLDVQNPFRQSAATPIVPNLRLGMYPSNDYHQFMATGAYNLTRYTRLTGKVAYGEARQDEPFLAYSVNGAAATAALPRSSLDGKVITKLVDLALTAKPMDKMNLRVALQHRENDNQSPIARYIYAGRDAFTVGAANTTADRTNAPLSTKETRALIETDYQIADRTTLRTAAERSRKEYTLADRSHTDTDKITLELRRPVSDEFTGSVGYVFTRRTGSDYDKNAFFRASYPTLYANTTTKFSNNPAMRSFLFGDYDEHRARATGHWVVDETLSLQGVVDSYRQKANGPECNVILDPAVATAVGTLPDRCLGRNLAHGGSISLDVQYQPEEALTAFAFANYALTFVGQNGRQMAAGNVKSSADSTRDTVTESTYLDATVGVGFKWQPEETWDLGGTLVNQQGKGLIDTFTGSSAVFAPTTPPAAPNPFAVIPLPDLTTRLNSLQLFAKYDYSKNLSWRFNYVYENLKTEDWNVDGLSPNSARFVLTPGLVAPRYSNHVFGASAVIKNW